MPEMIYVDSSNIEAIGYDEIAQELHVRFLSGNMYAYHSVRREIYEAIMNAASKGNCLNREVKGVYEYSKL